jgi:hypothetical protein
MVFLNDLIGKPFRMGAKGPDFYSCYGLLLEVYRRMGVALPNVDNSNIAEGHDLLANFIDHPEDVIPHLRSLVPHPDDPILPQLRYVDEWAFILDFAVTNKIVLQEVMKSKDWVKVPAPEKNCMAVFLPYVPALNGRYPHMGVFIDKRKFIHAVPPQVMLTGINTPWRACLTAIYKFVRTPTEVKYSSDNLLGYENWPEARNFF